MCIEQNEFVRAPTVTPICDGTEVALINHISLSVCSLDASTQFYEAVLATIGWGKLVVTPKSVGFGREYVCFWLDHRPETPAAGRDPANYIALQAQSTKHVDRFHRTALKHGGTDDFAPGLLASSLSKVHAAFVKDPEGNRIGALTILP